jgi:hypothetical protein
MTLGLHDLDGGKSIFRALKISPFLGPKKSHFQIPPLPMALVRDLPASNSLRPAPYKRYTHKTSGFKTSETSGLQNIRFTIRQVFKTSGCKKHPYIFCTCGWWKSAGSCAALFAGKVMAVFYSLF